MIKLTNTPGMQKELLVPVEESKSACMYAA